MTLRAPVAVELGWFIVTNSAELPIEPDEIVRPATASRSTWYAGRWGSATVRTTSTASLGDWAAQVDLPWIVGLLLRGWRKGLDAEAGGDAGSGVLAARRPRVVVRSARSRPPSGACWPARRSSGRARRGRGAGRRRARTPTATAMTAREDDEVAGVAAGPRGSPCAST